MGTDFSYWWRTEKKISVICKFLRMTFHKVITEINNLSSWTLVWESQGRKQHVKLTKPPICAGCACPSLSISEETKSSIHRRKLCIWTFVVWDDCQRWRAREVKWQTWKRRFKKSEWEWADWRTSFDWIGWRNKWIWSMKNVRDEAARWRQDDEKWGDHRHFPGHVKAGREDGESEDSLWWSLNEAAGKSRRRMVLAHPKGGKEKWKSFSNFDNFHLNLL